VMSLIMESSSSAHTIWTKVANLFIEQ
jgi:hypothetical protein